MKNKLTFLGMFFLFLISACQCQAQSGSLQDFNGNSVDPSAQKVVILIHGWNPSGDNECL